MVLQNLSLHTLKMVMERILVDGGQIKDLYVGLGSSWFSQSGPVELLPQVRSRTSCSTPVLAGPALSFLYWVVESFLLSMGPVCSWGLRTSIGCCCLTMNFRFLQYCFLWFPVVTWTMEINTDSSCSRTMGTDMALGNSSGIDVIMASVAI